MASSSVQYYEKQKELQDKIASSEQRRMDLERELRMSLQSGQTSSKMKAARLHSYWKKICDDEKKAKQRNESLMREFERIDAHMHEMSARTQRLYLMKKQYEDYISRTYPQWNELMYGKPQPIPVPDRLVQHTQVSTQEAIPSPSTSTLSEKHAEGNDISATFIKQTVTTTNSSSSIHSKEGSRIPTQVSTSSHQIFAKPDEPSRDRSYQHTTHQEEIYQNLPSHRSEDDKHIEYEKSDVDRHITSQPVQSIAIQSRTSGQTIQQSSNYSMEPLNEDDDDISDFGTDTDIPMAKSAVNTIVRSDAAERSDASKNKFHGVIKPELSIDGLLRLLMMVENDIIDAFSLEGYYRSSWPETSVKNDIVRKANANEDLSRVDVNLISMVILEQITLIIRSLSEKCLIPDIVLEGDIITLSPHKLSQHLSTEAQMVWNALFAHFVKLVDSQVMKSYELSAIFTPCMVLDTTSQDKAHAFVVQLLESLDNPGPPKMNTATSLSPAATLEGSGSFVEDGKVPRLKFGSLLEKPLSDDDSSFINSLPRDSVPLNETAAYKSMISTGGSDPPKRQSSTQEDTTDEDVEKQIASALSKPAAIQSPRKKVEVDDLSETTTQTMSHVYVPTALDTRSPRQPIIPMQKKFQGVKISSDLDTDTEVDAGVFGSSRQPDDDFDFYD